MLVSQYRGYGRKIAVVADDRYGTALNGAESLCVIGACICGKLVSMAIAWKHVSGPSLSSAEGAEGRKKAIKIK